MKWGTCIRMCVEVMCASCVSWPLKKQEQIPFVTFLFPYTWEMIDWNTFPLEKIIRWIHRSGIVGDRIGVWSILSEISIQFANVVAPFYSDTVICKSTSCSTSSPRVDVISLFNFSHCVSIKNLMEVLIDIFCFLLILSLLQVFVGHFWSIRSSPLPVLFIFLSSFEL